MGVTCRHMDRQRRPRRPHRTWPQRLLLTLNVFAISVSLAFAALIVYARDTVADTQRTRILDVQGWVPAERVPPGEPINFLVLGNDAKEGLDPDDPILDGRDEITGSRSDVIMVIRLDPKTSEAKVLSLPRDLWVTIPGRGHERINAAMDYGEDSGPSKLIETINAEFGITINHYVEVDFAGFKNIIEVIGGIPFYISHPLRDGRSQLDQPEVGCNLLDQHQALAYVRSRNLEWKDSDGKWIKDPTVDIGRNGRQQEFLQRVVAQAIRKGVRNPATLNRLIQNAQSSVTLDRYMSAQDLLNLGRAFDSFEPEDLGTFQLPVYGERVQGKDVLHLVHPQADLVLDGFRGTGHSGIAGELNAADINLRVLNGGAPEGAAIETSDLLRQHGFRTRTPADGEAVQKTEVRFSSGDLLRARFLARHLATDVTLIADPSVSEITIVLGPDHRGVLEEPKADEEVPSTTAGVTTTTSIDSTENTTDAANTAPQTTTTLDERGDPASDSMYVPGAVLADVSC